MASKSRPATTPEGREEFLIGLAMDLAEKRILDGTATSQEVTSILRLGTTKERLEKEKLARELELLKAKTDQLKSQKNMEELYSKALVAIGIYSGQGGSDETYDD